MMTFLEAAGTGRRLRLKESLNPWDSWELALYRYPYTLITSKNSMWEVEPETVTVTRELYDQAWNVGYCGHPDKIKEMFWNKLKEISGG